MPVPDHEHQMRQLCWFALTEKHLISSWFFITLSASLVHKRSLLQSIFTSRWAAVYWYISKFCIVFKQFYNFLTTAFLWNHRDVSFQIKVTILSKTIFASSLCILLDAVPCADPARQWNLFLWLVHWLSACSLQFFSFFSVIPAPRPRDSEYPLFFSCFCHFVILCQCAV